MIALDLPHQRSKLSAWGRWGMRFLSVFTRVSCVLMLALLGAGALVQPISAQVLYGSVVGTVEDQSGAVVPNATVTMTNKQTGVTRETTSDAGGRYSVVNVLPGGYELKVTATGFRTFTQQSL